MDPARPPPGRPRLRSISGCIRWWLCYTFERSTKFTDRSPQQTAWPYTEGFVRLIRPVLVARLLSTLLGVAACLPASAVPADAGSASRPRRAVGRPPPRRLPRTRPRRRTRARAASRRARASVRAREQARLRGLQAPPGGDDARGSRPTRTARSSPTSAPPRRSSSIRITGQVIYEENSQDKRSIASITKVMTALDVSSRTIPI